MAICAHYEETVKIRHIHGAEAVLSAAPDEKRLLKYTRFENSHTIHDFSDVLSYFQAVESILIHIPEYMADRFLSGMSPQDLSRLRKIENIHINIMLQNIRGLRFMKSIKSMERYGKVTCTTAHRKYTTPALRRELGVPVHLLSARGNAKGYKRKTYTEKDDLMIISPDEHPMKSRVLKLIGENLPQIRLQIISNMTYEEYKRLIERAKWALTFGEGLDGYFVETILSGGISFSAYNADFFTEDFKALRTVYDDYDSLAARIGRDIGTLDEKSAYTDYQNEQYAICSKYYNGTDYFRNLELFYKGLYTYR